jgi:hypothetical protein
MIRLFGVATIDNHLFSCNDKMSNKNESIAVATIAYCTYVDKRKSICISIVHQNWKLELICYGRKKLDFSLLQFPAKLIILLTPLLCNGVSYRDKDHRLCVRVVLRGSVWDLLLFFVCLVVSISWARS